MPIYKVTTEGDCEGRSVRVLGYVNANSPEHAMKYMKYIGEHAYYDYCVQEQKDVIKDACPEHLLTHLEVTSVRTYGRSDFPIRYGSVKEKEDLEKTKREKIEQIKSELSAMGLSVKDLVN